MTTPRRPSEPRRRPDREPPRLPRGVRIVHEDDDILIVDKPTGLVTADPARSTGGPPAARQGQTLFDILKAHARAGAGRRRTRDRTAAPGRLWIIHRLDKEASGLLVFAKSERAFNWLKEDFRAKRVHRIYMAVAEGVVGEPGHASTKQSFIEDRDAPPRAQGSDASAGPKLAVTHYRVLAAGQGRTLLQVRLETGRKNQIRIHMSELRHPLVGDARFGAATNPINRLGLHAAELGFNHPATGAPVRFTSPTPPSFYRCVGAKPPREAEKTGGAEPLGGARREGGAGLRPAFSGRPAHHGRVADHRLEEGGPEARPTQSNPALETNWNEVAGWYDELLEDRGNDHYEQVILPGTLRLLEPRPGARILDVACGQGILCRRLAELGARAVGVDGAPRLIEAARARGSRGPGSAEYHVGDARELPALGLTGFDAATCVMALANIDPLEPVFRGIAGALRPGGALVAVITHPAFRAPGQTAWGWDDKAKRQYRRVDGYLSPGQHQIQMHPGKAARGRGGATTWTFHRPLQAYVESLAKAGFLLEKLEEWPSLRASSSGPRAPEENRARREIPLFLGLRAVRR